MATDEEQGCAVVWWCPRLLLELMPPATFWYWRMWQIQAFEIRKKLLQCCKKTSFKNLIHAACASSLSIRKPTLLRHFNILNFALRIPSCLGNPGPSLGENHSKDKLESCNDRGVFKNFFQPLTAKIQAILCFHNKIFSKLQ